MVVIGYLRPTLKLSMLVKGDEGGQLASETIFNIYSAVPS